jgi:hypothetical protein
MKRDRMYGDLAWLWPLISPREDYAREALDWRDALRAKLGPGRHEILELGVGGGHNLSYLTDAFQATAVDLSEGMLEHSRRLNPDVEHFVGDMRTVRLGRRFHAVLIHDAIGYMRSEEELVQAFGTAAAHLEPGGVLITSPDFFRETFQDPQIHHSRHSDGETELTFLEYCYDPDPGDTTVESVMTYLIRRGGEVRIEHDRHVTGLFPKRTWLRLIEEAGFDVEEWPCRHGDDPRQAVLLVGILRRPG